MPGALMLDIAGLELTADDRQLLKKPQVGGLILFSRNYSDPQQLSNLISEIRKEAPDILIAVDQEGGRVQRFREGFVRIPPMALLGELYKESVEAAQAAAENLGWLMASELLAYGVDISFAPVLDLDFGVSEVIGDRAFASDADQVTLLAGAFIRGMHDAGMAATGKHFPGHGWVVADSHLEIPVDTRTLEDIETQDLKPFAQLIKQGLDAVMPAHVIYDKVDSKPAGFSPFWIEKKLRTEHKFDGVAFSDDLTMEGASVAGGFVERAEQALSAGCDMLLVCNNREAALEVLEYLEQTAHQGSQRITTMQRRSQPVLAELQASERWQRAVVTAKQLNERCAGK